MGEPSVFGFRSVRPNKCLFLWVFASGLFGVGVGGILGDGKGLGSCLTVVFGKKS